jgi:hypothetical protein
MVMDIFADDVLEQRVWKVPETDDFFEAFMRLPVCTVISTSQVARNFATRTEQGEYVLFGEERKWLPQIEIHKTSVPVLAEEAMSHALAQGYFKHQLKSFKSRFGFQRTEATIEQQAMIAWMSSPLALDEVLTKTVQDVYDVEFIRSQPERQHMLQPIIDELQQLAYQDDAKLLALVHHLDTCLQQQQKVLIFTERLATAVYLERGLQHFLPDAHIANVVHETETGTYELKEFEKEVAPLICDFAPIANSDKTAVYATGKSYNVLVSTDAFAAGVNLQDASVVISYDLAWTPEVIIQRAGRILRFWREPRQVALFVFVGTFVVDVEHQQTARRVEARLRRLVQRTRHAEKFSELPMIPEGESATYATLSNLASVTTEHIGRVDITQIEEFSGVSPFLMHITALSQHRDYAQQIPDDLTSAIYYDGSHHLIYLLLRYEGTFEWMLYDVQAKRLLPVKEDQLLDLIQCSEDTEPAPVDPVVVEKYAQMARRRWIEKKAIDTPDAVERICALYLIPETANIAAMFREVLTP